MALIAIAGALSPFVAWDLPEANAGWSLELLPLWTPHIIGALVQVAAGLAAWRADRSVPASVARATAAFWVPATLVWSARFNFLLRDAGEAATFRAALPRVTDEFTDLWLAALLSAAVVAAAFWAAQSLVRVHGRPERG